MRILLISNYLPDRQESMLRFASMLQDGLRSNGHQVETIRPFPRFGQFSWPTRGLRKWAAYVDKLVCFPFALRIKSRKFELSHICDHSNAVYRRWISSGATSATCHDLLAIRGAMGESTYCPATTMGKRLQSAILKNLSLISHVACDSNATLADFSRLTGRQPSSSLRTIHLSFSPAFATQARKDERLLESILGDSAIDYILHVGSSQLRKNREGILHAVEHLGSRWDGTIVFVGEALRPDQKALAAKLGLSNRVIELGHRPDTEIAALYANARAFVFPSLSEGFGWPILEAQSCGCPVITSGNTSLPEVAGKGAIIVDADNSLQIADAILHVGESGVRQALVDDGLSNLDGFTMDSMIRKYETLFRDASSHVY